VTRVRNLAYFSKFPMRLECGQPSKKIYNFVGMLYNIESGVSSPLQLQNTLWANSVVASGSILGIVVYTGTDTRVKQGSSKSRIKFGLTDSEVYRFSYALFAILLILSVILISRRGFAGQWMITYFRYFILLSAIIPISLRVNLDLAKIYYARVISNDRKIPNSIVRSSTISEDLARVSYLFSDKTGTLTRNVMSFKKICLEPPLVIQRKEWRKCSLLLLDYLKNPERCSQVATKHGQCMEAMALTHNVNPVISNSEGISYSGASPDEMALVEYSRDLGLTLCARDDEEIVLKDDYDCKHSYKILHSFPFTSATKRMGMIVKDPKGQIVFFVKGAESIMKYICKQSDWMDEEVENLAHEGLRTLVFGRRVLDQDMYKRFNDRLKQAEMAMVDREEKIMSVRQSIEHSLTLLGVTGVEDQLQEDVQGTLETLRNAGIKI